MNLKRITSIITCMLFVAVINAQDKFFTKNGKIEFSSNTDMEDIDAKNKTAVAVLDAKSGAIQFSVVMKSFEFEKALMQEHFNENYVESDKYPRAEIKGVVLNNSDIKYDKNGTYHAKVKGKMTIHGVTREVETTGTIKADNGKLDLNATFNILLSDYNIKIPSVVKDKLSNSIKVKVDCKLEPLKG